MPIEIRITDVSALTAIEVGELNAYLLNSVRRNEQDKQTTHIQFEPSVDVDVLNLTDIPVQPSPIKTRKKRKVKEEQQPVTFNPELKEADVFPQIPPPPLEEITYTQLIAYVLEAVRDKKIAYDKVMEVVGQFQIPNLNELNKYPHVINPIYKKLKELESE